MKRHLLKQVSLIIRVLSMLVIVALLAPGPRLWAQPQPMPKFAYVANQGSNDISAYTIDATTGVLTPVPGSPFPAGTTPSVVTGTFSPSPQPCSPCFAYVANQGSNDISAYTVNATTGVLTPVAGSPFLAGTTPFFVQFPPPPCSPQCFAYVANQGSNDISAYTVNATTGALTPVAGSPFPAGMTPFLVMVTTLSATSGQLFAYVANQGSNDISAYMIDATTGALTPVAGSPFPAGTAPVFVTVVPAGAGQLLAYVANQSSNDISAYMIDATTGALTPIAGSPFPAGTTPFLVTFNTSPSGQLFAYVANQGSNDISAYMINATTGALTPVAGSPFPAGTTPVFVAPLPPLGPFGISHKFACVANQGSNDISAYMIDATTGALTPASGSPFPAGTTPFFCSVLFR